MSARIAVAALAAALVGCGDEGASQETGATDRATAASVQAGDVDCGLLDAGEASAAMGEAMRAGVERLRVGDPATGRGMLQCQHDGEASSASLSVQVQLNPEYDRPATFADFLAMMRAEAEGSDNRLDQINLDMLAEAQPVTDLGRFAYWLPDARTLTVHTGRGHAITIGVARWGSGSSAAADLEVARKAATAVLDKL